MPFLPRPLRSSSSTSSSRSSITKVWMGWKRRIRFYKIFLWVPGIVNSLNQVIFVPFVARSCTKCIPCQKSTENAKCVQVGQTFFPKAKFENIFLSRASKVKYLKSQNLFRPIFTSGVIFDAYWEKKWTIYYNLIMNFQMTKRSMATKIIWRAAVWPCLAQTLAHSVYIKWNFAHLFSDKMLKIASLCKTKGRDN